MMTAVSPLPATSKSSSKKPLKRVRFGGSTVHEVSRWEQKNELWYSKQEIHENAALDCQKLVNRQAQLGDGKLIESNNYTWRGLENCTQGYEYNFHQHSVHDYVEHIVLLSKRPSRDAEDLRRLSKAHTKDNRVRAQMMGKADFVNAYSNLLKDRVFFFRQKRKPATMVLSSRYFVFPGLERKACISKLVRRQH